MSQGSLDPGPQLPQPRREAPTGACAQGADTQRPGSVGWAGACLGHLHTAVPENMGPSGIIWG